ncbi:hypothetical protein Agub_g12021 [Astrephomene gubernaculifera]|uniref:Protein kinase domain-containing protein n=1 Tax=Astrephomene gubernaculifera TaxID=47775 RepID=A0AAD3E0B5_9CHLO|nr:hypothetical protein Agub_g12021 [Astrephomene gubernaculifera]
MRVTSFFSFCLRPPDDTVSVALSQKDEVVASAPGPASIAPGTAYETRAALPTSHDADCCARTEPFLTLPTREALQRGSRSNVIYSTADELVKDVQDLRWLGQGAQGVVYEGIWQGATVAVKFSIVEDLDTTAYELLFSRLLSHPNVVQTYVAKVAVLDEKTIHPQQHRPNDLSSSPLSRSPFLYHHHSSSHHHSHHHNHPATAAATAAHPPLRSAAISVPGAQPITTSQSFNASAAASAASAALCRPSAPILAAAAGAATAAGGGSTPRVLSLGGGSIPTARGSRRRSTGNGGASGASVNGFPSSTAGFGGSGALLGPLPSCGSPSQQMAGRTDSFQSDDGFGDPFGRRSTFTDVRAVLASMGAKPGHFITQMVMEHCDHGSLHAAIQRGIFKPNSRWGPKLALRALIRTVREVAQGMFHLHSNNVLHGDLKPANVLLINSRKDRRGYIAKVSDFGLAQFCNKDQDHISNAPWGTLVYMAPERLLHGQLFPASDVFSFGVMLWEMYHGQRPYEGLHAAQIVMACAQGVSHLTWAPDACEELVRISRACLAASPHERPSFEQLMQQLALLEARVRLEGPRISTSVEVAAASSCRQPSSRLSVDATPLRRATTATGATSAAAASTAPGGHHHPQPQQQPRSLQSPQQPLLQQQRQQRSSLECYRNLPGFGSAATTRQQQQQQGAQVVASAKGPCRRSQTLPQLPYAQHSSRPQPQPSQPPPWANQHQEHLPECETGMPAVTAAGAAAAATKAQTQTPAAAAAAAATVTAAAACNEGKGSAGNFLDRPASCREQQQQASSAAALAAAAELAVAGCFSCNSVAGTRESSAFSIVTSFADQQPLSQPQQAHLHQREHQEQGPRQQLRQREEVGSAAATEPAIAAHLGSQHQLHREPQTQPQQQPQRQDDRDSMQEQQENGGRVAEEGASGTPSVVAGVVALASPEAGTQQQQHPSCTQDQQREEQQQGGVQRQEGYRKQQQQSKDDLQQPQQAEGEERSEGQLYGTMAEEGTKPPHAAPLTTSVPRLSGGSSAGGSDNNSTCGDGSVGGGEGGEFRVAPGLEELQDEELAAGTIQQQQQQLQQQQPRAWRVISNRCEDDGVLDHHQHHHRCRHPHPEATDPAAAAAAAAAGRSSRPATSPGVEEGEEGEGEEEGSQGTCSSPPCTNNSGSHRSNKDSGFDNTSSTSCLVVNSEGANACYSSFATAAAPKPHFLQQQQQQQPSPQPPQQQQTLLPALLPLRLSVGGGSGSSNSSICDGGRCNSSSRNCFGCDNNNNNNNSGSRILLPVSDYDCGILDEEAEVVSPRVAASPRGIWGSGIAASASSFIVGSPGNAVNSPVLGSAGSSANPSATLPWLSSAAAGAQPQPQQLPQSPTQFTRQQQPQQQQPQSQQRAVCGQVISSAPQQQLQHHLHLPHPHPHQQQQHPNQHPNPALLNLHMQLQLQFPGLGGGAGAAAGGSGLRRSGSGHHSPAPRRSSTSRLLRECPTIKEEPNS